MIGFYLHANPIMQGRQVELRVFRGTRERPGDAHGALVFAPDEWEKFRTIIVGGMRAAGYLRIPVEFMDGTRQKPPSLIPH